MAGLAYRYLWVIAVALAVIETTICASIRYSNPYRDRPANTSLSCMQPPLSYDRRCLSEPGLRHHRRQANGERSAAWQEAVRKGEERLRLLAASIDEVPQSPFVDPDDLRKYGWRLDADVDADIRTTSYLSDWREAWTELRLPESEGSTRKVEWGQKVPSVEIDGQVYQPTGGRFSNIYNPEIILGSVAYSPLHKAPAHDPPVAEEDVTPLRKWSDVAFLEQVRQCDGDAARLKRLRFVGAMSVVTGSTRDILVEALGGEESLAEMPRGWGFRKVWKADSEVGRAVLGTAHGAWPAYLLAQHKRQFGVKTVTGIVLMLGSGRKFDLLFVLGDM